jgi:hypothetical protein
LYDNATERSSRGCLKAGLLCFEVGAFKVYGARHDEL